MKKCAFRWFLLLTQNKTRFKKRKKCDIVPPMKAKLAVGQNCPFSCF
jgi:hypothetical protein